MRPRIRALTTSLLVLVAACSDGSGTSGDSSGVATAPAQGVSPAAPLEGEPFEVTFTSRRDGTWSIYSVDEDLRLDEVVDIVDVEAGPPHSWLDLIGQPAWSPDGTSLAFACAHLGRPDICVTRGGGEPEVVTHSAGEGDTHPHWAPDGERIYFTSDLRGERDVFSIRADGSDLEPVVVEPRGQLGLRVSPDGRLVAYSEVAKGILDVEIARVRRHGVRVVRTIERAAMPSWSPDGSQIAVSRPRGSNRADLFVYSVEDRTLERLTRSPGLDAWPAWSPSGDAIAFTRDTELKDDSYQRSDVFVVDVATGDVTQLTDDPELDMHPTWRPLR